MCYKYFIIDVVMQKNAAVFTAGCILLCLTFNYTFPLHRQSKRWLLTDEYLRNHSKVCHNVAHRAIVDRTKKMASIIENSLKKIKDSTQDISKNIYSHINGAKFPTSKNTLSDENLRQYEQLVMMKKYPYLDLKELDFKYSPSSSKNARQLKLELHSNINNDQSFCEQLDEGPNVEIYNRGLSGFSIPSKPKTDTAEELKWKLNRNSQNNVKIETNAVSKLSPNRNLMQSLRKDIHNFENKDFIVD